MNNNIKYIKPLNGNKPDGGYKCPKQLIGVSDKGTYFISFHENVQALEMAYAGEGDWAEYHDQTFFAFIYKLKDNVKMDLNKITSGNWEEYVGDVFGTPTENVELMWERSEGDKYWYFRKLFESYLLYGEAKNVYRSGKGFVIHGQENQLKDELKVAQ